jgi:hypothetical protein
MNRFLVLANSHGYLTCVAANDKGLLERYKTWQVLLKVNKPLTYNRADICKRWAIALYGL